MGLQSSNLLSLSMESVRKAEETPNKLRIGDNGISWMRVEGEKLEELEV